MTEKVTLLVYVPAYMSGSYSIIKRADCGGSYQGEWDNSTSTWVTKIYRAPTYTKPMLTKTFELLPEVDPALLCEEPFSQDGYTGELLLDVQSIKVEATGYSTVTDNHPHTVTKTYELAYNDRSLVPESVQSDGPCGFAHSVNDLAVYSLAHRPCLCL